LFLLHDHVGCPPGRHAWKRQGEDRDEPPQGRARPRRRGRRRSAARRSPAWADDEDDAKDACKRIAENRDWDDTKAKVSKEGENRIVVTMTGERNNNDKERRCVYNSNSKEARFVGD
jgi:hypothetical protein